jgi:hypothetical protein
MNFIKSFGGIVVVVRLFSGREWLTIAIWFSLIFSLSFLISDVPFSLHLILSGMLTCCLVLTSLIGILGDKVAYNDTKFEIADSELVRVSHLTDELQEKIADLENELRNKT